MPGGVTASANPPTQGSKYRIKVGQTIAAIVWSNIATTVKGFWTILYDDGSPDYWPVVETASGSSRAAVLVPTSQIAKKNGWVVDGYFGVNTPTVPQRGQCYIQGVIVDTNLSVTSSVICCGYSYAGHVVSIGTFVEPGPAGGPGQIKSVNLGDPALNAQIAAQTVPTGAIILLRSVSAPETAAGAATRNWTVQYTDGTGLIISQPTSAIELTGVLANLEAAIGLTTIANAGVDDDLSLPILYLIATWTWQPILEAIAAADNIGQSGAVVEEWVVPS